MYIRYVPYFTLCIESRATDQPCCKIAVETDPQRRPTCFPVRPVAVLAFWRQYDQRSFFDRVPPIAEFNRATPVFDEDNLPFVQGTPNLP